MSETIVRVDADAVQSWLAHEPERGEEFRRLFNADAPPIVIAEMQRQAPVRTGFLRASITSQQTPTGFTVFPTAPYAPYVERGTGPHIIFPSKTRVLRWYNEAGQPVFAAYAQHPGFVGRWFVWKTVITVRDQLRELAAYIWRQMHD